MTLIIYNSQLTIIKTMSIINGTENKYTYNGKELVDDFGLNWYHYGARYYDPTLGRWHSIDPVDEFHSPYVYCHGDPVNFYDSNGMWEDPIANSALRIWFGLNTKPTPEKSLFGLKRRGANSHQGIDIYALKGTPIKACITGVISRIGVDSGKKNSKGQYLTPYGNSITITVNQTWIDKDGKTRNEKYSFFYAHLNNIEKELKVGDIVSEGDIIGYTGKTGNAKDLYDRESHLHFEVRESSAVLGQGLDLRLDPTKFLKDLNSNPNPESQK